MPERVMSTLPPTPRERESWPPCVVVAAVSRAGDAGAAVPLGGFGLDMLRSLFVGGCGAFRFFDT
jgi:hypothetical protein